MIQFDKLRISGFKSFPERTELEIGPGLNGVVGPNGCGKSNLVEALRWVMGENSAKRMRGDGMEDVIFNGTESRSARNIAEVSLILNNSTRSAPAAYNGGDVVVIIRKIERDHGSAYKINGKNVRARDVHMFFADTVTGASSPALVSQGRVTQIINAKPIDRRLILEESAGISGLFARRHEAELRLRAADANMLRLEDVLGGLETNLNSLKRQSRQATRYRNVSAQIRQLEILVAWLEWRTLEKRIESARELFANAEAAVTKKMAAVAQLTKTQTTQAQDLPALRQAEAEIAATLQTRKIALQRLDDEAARLDRDVRDTDAQMEQIIIDQAHEKDTVSESAEAAARLDKEQATLVALQNDDSGKLEEKQQTRNALEEKVVNLEEQYTALMQSAAESRARKQSLEQQIQANIERMDTIKSRRAKAAEDLEKMPTTANLNADIVAQDVTINELEASAKKLNQAIEDAQNEVQVAQEDLNEARDALSKAESRASEFKAEISMLENLFREEKDGKFTPVLSQVNADSGFEKALSRALGDALLAGLEDDAPARWRSRKALNDMPSLPSGVQSLLPKVKAPKELHLALSQIGLVDDEAQGSRFADDLSPGQSLVSRDGTYWRWDGYTVKAEATDRNAIRLEQKNRLAELTAKSPEIEGAKDKAREAMEVARVKLDECETARRTQSASLKSTEETLTQARAALSRLREGQARADSDMARLQDIIKLSDEDILALEEAARLDQERLKAYEQDSLEKKEEDTENLRQALIEARDAYNAAMRAFDIFQQQQNSRSARLHAIADERINLQNRLIRCRERMKQLEERRQSLAEKLEQLKSQPKDFEDGKEELLNQISELEVSRGKAAEALATCESEVAKTTKALKEAESSLSESRESRAGSQATHATLEEQRVGLEQTIIEQFSVKPSELPEHAQIDAAQDAPVESLESLKEKKEKLSRERDGIGAVNLRADEEAQTLEVQVNGMLAERNDLAQAIEELRGGINKINKEARDRLMVAFEHVNTHFQELFQKLFKGGKAHLALINAEDPLGAGLEIFAQPPGKALQSLSLLSGGEQTLASIALIFAMFLTNPSPICVLDEIDAPLDDANVDRVCDLLKEIAARGETRFLVITHHRLTMARMDRLYGVTMAEKGVSQLVSVDLQQSFEFLEAA